MLGVQGSTCPTDWEHTRRTPSQGSTSTAGGVHSPMPSGTKISVEGGIPEVTLPSFDKSFRPGKVKEIMTEVLKSRLDNLTYDPDNCSTWCRDIADEVKQQLKTLGMDRFKWVVQVVIGEQKGAGVQIGARAFWDNKTDQIAEEKFVNESIFAVCVVAGVYLY